MRLLFAALIFLTTPAFAQIVPTTVNVSLAPQGDSTQTVGLKFSVPDVIGGCWDIGELAHETAMQDPFYMDVRIQSYTRKEGACGGVNQQASAIVPIEKKLLADGKIKVLRLSIGPTTDRYNVTYDNGRMSILPQSQTIFKTAQELVYNFDKATKNTGALLALIVPTAPTGVDTTQAISDFASMYGLTPAPESATSSLPAMNGGTAIHYYHDARGALSPGVLGDFSQVGSTTIPATYDLPDGRGQEFIPAPVYAKKVD